MTRRADTPPLANGPMLRESLSDTEPFLRGILASGVLLLLALAVEHLFFTRGFYSSLVLHPFWIIVLLATLESGLYVGVATAGLAALLMDWPPRPIGVDITAYFLDLAILPLQWLLAALCIGVFRQADLRALADLRRENARLLEMGEALAAEILQADQAVRDTELRVVTQRHEQGVTLSSLAELVALQQGARDGLAARTRAAAARFTPLPCDVLTLSQDGLLSGPDNAAGFAILARPVRPEDWLADRLRRGEAAFATAADALGHPGKHLVLAPVRGHPAHGPSGVVCFLADSAESAEELCPLAELLSRALAAPLSRTPVLHLTKDQKVTA